VPSLTVVDAPRCSRQRLFLLPLLVNVEVALDDVCGSVGNAFTDVGQMRLHDAVSSSSGSGPALSNCTIVIATFEMITRLDFDYGHITNRKKRLGRIYRQPYMA